MADTVAQDTPKKVWVTALRDYFLNRTDHVAVLAPWGKPTPVRVKDDEHLESLIRSHVLGEEAVVMFTRPDGGSSANLGVWRLGSYCPAPVTLTTKWLCIDVDAGGGHKAQVKDPQAVTLRILKRAEQLELQAYAELSKSGEGFHIWVFFDKPLEAKVARDLGLCLCPSDVELEVPTRTGETIADATRNRGLEVFPKQAKIGKDGFGNMLWLPWFCGNENPYGNHFARVTKPRLGPAVVTWEDNARLWVPFKTVDKQAVGVALGKAGGWRKDEKLRGSMKGTDIWKQWREDALAAVPLEDIYGTQMTGKRCGADNSWLQARDPWAPDGDQNPSAGVATGEGEAERGAFHSFISEESLSLFDFLIRRGEARTFADAVSQVAKLSGVGTPVLEKSTGTITPAKKGRPQVFLNDAELHDLVAQGWAAVLKWNQPPKLFRNSGAIIRLQQRGADNRLEPQRVPARSIPVFLAEAAQWCKTTPAGAVAAFPPEKVGNAMADLVDDELPELDAVVRAPFFDKAGRLIREPGFHEGARVWFDQAGSLDVGEIPKDPSPEDVEAALKLLLGDLLVDFPFVSKADRAHALAMLLLPFVRQMFAIQLTPMHLVEAPTKSSGKSALVEIAHLLATGSMLNARSLPMEEEEERKTILAELLASPTVLCWDNLPDRKEVVAQALCNVLTADSITGRFLGQTGTVTALNRCTWVATGNNPRLHRDLASRSIRIRMDAGMQHPDKRTFKHAHIQDWTMRHRKELVGALLVIAQAWLAAGRPTYAGGVRMRFPSWADTMGGILENVGVEGFLGNMEEFYEEADAESEEWTAFVEAWAERWQVGPVPSGELLAMADEQNLLETLRTGNQRGDAKRMGMALASRRDQVFGPWRIIRGPLVSKSRRWCLRPAGGK